MSVPEVPAGPPPPGRSRPLGGCAAAFIMLIGVVLLLPGVCSLWFIVSTGAQGWDVLVGSLWIITLGIGAAGILLIRYVLRNR
jgi:hypothetical protein